MLTVMLVACAMPAVANASQTGKSAAAGPITPVSPRSTYETTTDYVTRFYPRYPTFWIQSVAPKNRFIAPISRPNGLLPPVAKLVNAFNTDTIYASSVNTDLSEEPDILTMPPYANTSSLLTVDVWGNVFKTGIVPGVAGVYALVGPGWHGTLPSGVTRVDVPYPTTTWIIRADRYTRSGSGYVNTVPQAREFIRRIRMLPLSQYRTDPTGGRPIPTPGAFMAAGEKQITETAMRDAPNSYLDKLQEAMHSPATLPLTASDRALSAAFDAIYAAAKAGVSAGDYGPMSQIVDATRNVNQMVLSHYYAHTVPGTAWINFDNMGAWGTNYLDRDATTAFIFLGNDASAARYWDTFYDHNNVPLNTDIYPRYTIKFPKGTLPDAKRFWSLSAYVGPALQIVPVPPVNGQRNVASYSPGLRFAGDGSLTIYIQPDPPIPSRRRNWIRVLPHEPFSLVLRSYGPQGNTAVGTVYTPPEVKPLGVL